MEKEIWKDLVGYEGLYSVNLKGDVMSHPRKGTKGKIMSPNDNGKGYLRIKLTKNNKEKRVTLHRIIAEAFINNPHNYKVLNHINGIKTDNRIENLEWCTQKQNIEHSYKIGLSNNTGINNHSCKLKEEDVLNIKKSILSITELSKKYKVVKTTIRDIKNNHTWKHIQH